MSTDPGVEQEAFEGERFEADLLQSQLEAEGRRCGRAYRRMRTLRAAGRLAEAAGVCQHGGGFPLDSIAAREGTTAFGIDPHAGESGWRCVECGSRLSASPWDDGVVTHPCEVVR